MRKFSFLISTVILLLLFGKLVYNYHDRYEPEDGLVLLESSAVDSSALVHAITAKNYLPSAEDAAFAAHHIMTVFESGESLGSLYDLNRRSWRIPAELIDREGSTYYRDLVSMENVNMGMDEMFTDLDLKTLPTTAAVSEDQSGSIVVNVKRQIDDAGIFARILGNDEEPCADVTVRLYEHFINEEHNPDSRTLAFARTDASGRAEFTGLDPESSYSVIPVRKGYEYGSSKGTVQGSLAKSGEEGILECDFTENEHKVKIFNTLTLKNIKSDHLMTVRTIDGYLMSMLIYIGIFFGVWWLFFLIYKWRNRGSDHSILSIIMLLTGGCLLMMFSMNDPLNDKLIGIDMAQGVIAGLIVMILLQAVDFTRFYQGRSRIPFDIPAALIKWMLWPLGLYKKADAFFERMPKGFGYMLAALFLTLLLFTPLGVAVGGMRVNLNLGIMFQPSEIAKYLIVIFMAAFFCANADKIVKFSNKGNVDLFGAKMKMLGGILLGLVFIMGLYLLLGDMGPAMVLSFTFIIMYSAIKSKVNLDGLSERTQLKHILTCDLAMLVYGVLSFIVMLYIGKIVGFMWIFCLAWFAIWIGVGIIRKHVFESAVVFNLIIAAFIFGSSIMQVIPGLDSVAERLEGRNEMCTNTWGTLPTDGAAADPGENTQVAEGLWGLASGGIMGQGIGQGNPSVIPAFHTDMILSSVGEQLGFIGILIIVALFILLLRKTIIHGYLTAHPFTFYLCLGIAVVTGVQFIIITLGSTGIIPLTGVTVPFFSFGKVSMILNLAAFGIVLSIARRNTQKTGVVEDEMTKMRRSQMKMYDYPIALSSLMFVLISVFILGVYLNYQVLERDETLIRPVYVNNTEGYPVVNYNPRIKMIESKMPIGRILDRNGRVLASSDAEAIIGMKDLYLEYGVDSASFETHMKARLRRYYPFGNHLFYMLGDYNTRTFFNSGHTRGYIAEEEHLSNLRGYDDRMKVNGEYVMVNLVSDSFKPGKFLAVDTMTISRDVQLRDYSALLPALKSGEDIGTKPKDVRLTLDAVLQTRIQNSLAEYIMNHSEMSQNNLLRVSVVLLDAEDGDLLASAMYPLPDQEKLMSLSDEELIKYDDWNRDEQWKAYTDQDLGLLYPSAPGSTAKVMSSIAALISDDLSLSEVKNLSYFNASEERTGYEYRRNLDHRIDMLTALQYSSNNYFIKLVNDKDLYDELAQVYSTVGARLIYEQPYTLFYKADSKIDSVMTVHSKNAVRTFDIYRENVEKTGERATLKGHPAWQLAWGQGELSVSPLTMARVASIAAGNGSMPVTRYSDTDQISQVPVDGLSNADLDYLRYCMKAEADLHDFGHRVYGKTGTAQRSFEDDLEQDGWYMGYCEGTSNPIAFAVRLERGPGSSDAWRLFKSAILPVLKDLKYIK